MSSSLPAGLDYLVEQITALPDCQPPVLVSDGWPDKAAVQVVIGLDPDDDDSEVTVGYSNADGMDAETVEVPCAILVHKAGSNAQKKARDQAFAIFDAIRRRIKDDPRFGGAIVPGLPARISRYRYTQTATAQKAGEGRASDIRFVITWTHRG